jgi:hypothetical protein
MAVEDPELSDIDVDEQEPDAPRRLPALTRWLVALGMILVLITLTLVSQTIQDQTLPMLTEVESMRATLTAVPQPLPGREEIGADMIQFMTNASTLSSLTATLTASHVIWPDVINRLSDYNASRVFLTAIAEQPGGTIVVSGQAINEQVVIDYTDRLRQSPRFSSVVVQSITLKSSAEQGSSGGSGAQFPGRSQYAEFVFSVTLSENVAS